jgi:hypothetical protein
MPTNSPEAKIKRAVNHALGIERLIAGLPKRFYENETLREQIKKIATDAEKLAQAITKLLREASN